MLEGEYKAICLDKYNGRLHLVSKCFRSLQYKEILVKIHFASIHPFDLLFMRGEYGEIEPTKFPMIPGFEGSGEIVSVGNETEKHLIGRRVACFANANKEGWFEGTWAEYHYTSAESIMIFDILIPYDKICSLINPLMAVGMLDTIKKAKTKCALQNAADTEVGKMLIKLTQKENIQMINLVKNYTHAKNLILIGATNVIVCENEWEMECKKLSQLLNPQVAFDCLGGEWTAKILEILPEDTALYHYGNLTEKDISKIASSELIFKGKSINGWWLIRWLRGLNAEEYEYWWEFIKTELSTGSKIFETKILNLFLLDNFDLALHYFSNNYTDGSVLFTISPAKLA